MFGINSAIIAITFHCEQLDLSGTKIISTNQKQRNVNISYHVLRTNARPLSPFGVAID